MKGHCQGDPEKKGGKVGNFLNNSAGVFNGANSNYNTKYGKQLRSHDFLVVLIPESQLFWILLYSLRFHQGTLFHHGESI